LNFQKDKKFYKSFILALSAILTLSLILPMFSTKTSAATLSITENQNEINELAKDIEFIFTDGSELKNEKYVVNEKVIIDKFGKESLPSITAFIKMVNGEELKPRE